MVRHLFDKQATSITLLHVIETLKGVPFEDMHDFYESLLEKAEQTLGPLKSNLEKDGFSVRLCITYGRRSETILQYITDSDIDLVIIRSHLLDRDQPRTSFGTLSHQIALAAPCSVFMIR
jgi:nucleotide-binding universal stress UspA family protein